MNNFKIKDLMISVHPQVKPHSGNTGTHLNMYAVAFEGDCGPGVSCGTTKPDCDMGVSCGTTKPDCAQGVSCGTTKPDCAHGVSCGTTKPAQYMMQGEGSAYSAALLNLKQTLAGMQAK